MTSTSAGATRDAISCRGITKTYRSDASSVPALVDVDFDSSGGITALFGPSGSGKSTLLRILAGMEHPDQGEVHLGPTRISRLSRRRFRRLQRFDLALVFQQPSHNLLEYLTARQHLELAAQFRQRGGDQIDDLLERIGLTRRAANRPTQLSGGEQQRLAFAAAVVGNPRWVLADEPTAELDATSAGLVLEVVSGLAETSQHHVRVGVARPRGPDDRLERRHPAPRAGRMTAAMGTVVLEARELCLSYRNGPLTVTPIDHFSLTLEAGELVAVVGRSGSGKTTLLNLFGGWERVQAGEIAWQGRTCDPAELRWTQVATVPQVPGLLEELTVRENIALPLLVGSDTSWDDALYGKRLARAARAAQPGPVGRPTSQGDVARGATTVLHRPGAGVLTPADPG